jgi:hypothetical protein
MDWTKVVVKQPSMNEQIHNPKRRLQNVEDCVRNNVFLCAFILWNLKHETISRFFWNIKPTHIDKNNLYACDNSLNYNKFYFIYDVFVSDPTRFAIRPLACFCAFCFERDWHHCLNESHVLDWKLVKICPKNTQFV